MKKRLFSILTLLTMTLQLISPVVFAQETLNENPGDQVESVEEAEPEEEIEEKIQDKESVPSEKQETELENEEVVPAEEIQDKELEREGTVKLEDLTIHDKDGNEIKEDEELIIKNDEKVEITAKGLSDKDYQWQIVNPESTGKDDEWIDIQDETEETLKIDYALIKNVLVEDATEIRVRSAEDQEHFSEAIKVKFVLKEMNEVKDKDEEKESVSYTSFSSQDDSSQDETSTDKFTVRIEYQIGGSATDKPIEDPYIAELNNEELMDNPFIKTVKSPEIIGYRPDRVEIGTDGVEPSDIFEFDGDFKPKEAREIHFNIEQLSRDVTIRVIYEPADVGFTVRHHQQNIEDDKYTLVDTEEIESGLTGDLVNGETNNKENSLAKEIEGFYSLKYPNSEIAADGKTVIDIYYDREYYLMSFDLGDGGFGVDPIYAKFGAPIKIDNDNIQRPGYEFDGWKEGIPETMPAEDTTMEADWKAQEVGYTVAYWRENANDDGYTFVDARSTKKVTPKEHGTSAIDIINEYKQHSYNDSEYFTYNEEKTKEANKDVQVKADESTVVNIYYTRNKYTLSFNPADERYIGRRFIGDWDASMTIKDSEVIYDRRNPYTIEAKYEQDISELWPSADNIISSTHVRDSWWTKYQLHAWQHLDSTRPQTSKVYTLTKDFIRFSQNNSTTEFTASWNDTVNEHRLLYYGASANSDVNEYELLYDEKAYSPAISFGPKDITGFIKPDSGDSKRENGIIVTKFYYERKKYKLEFHNIRPDDRSVARPILYEQNISEQYYEPENPPYNLDANGYEFAGWYNNAQLLDGDEFEFTEDTKMPAHDLNIFAKWTEKEHDVKFYNSLNDIDKDDPLKSYKVLHNQKIKLEDEELPEAKPEDDSFKFIGWFYRENGVEKGFNPENMSVTKPLNLYPKWRSDKLVEYDVYYILIDDKGKPIKDTEGKEINVAPPLLKREALAGSSKTFEPVYGNALYGEYREGFYPDAPSKALELKLEGANILKFYYKEAAEVKYTVRYLDKNSQPLIKIDPNHPGRLFYRDSEGEYYSYKDGKKEYAGFDGNLQEYIKEKTTRKAVITEEFEWITGYLPDSFYKRKVLTSDKEKNEIVFYYEQSAEKVPVIIKHFKQNTDGDGYTEVESDRKEIIKLYNPETPETVDLSKEKKEYSGYVFAGLTVFDGKELDDIDNIDKEVQITERGLELNYYYNRDTVNLTIKKITDGQYSSNDKFLFNVEGDDINMTVTVSGNEEVTITDLPAGEYTITEDTAWSWRYESVGNNSISEEITSDEIIQFKNKFSKNKWLSDEQSEENIFKPRGESKR